MLTVMDVAPASVVRIDPKFEAAEMMYSAMEIFFGFEFGPLQACHLYGISKVNGYFQPAGGFSGLMG
jgi:hypothetical protein